MPFFKTLVLISAALTSTAPSNPNVLKPTQATTVDLGTVHGSAYYVQAAGGFRLVATLDAGNGVPVRFIATLAEGQSASVSVPGSTTTEITFARVADGLKVRKTDASDDAVTASNGL